MSISVFCCPLCGGILEDDGHSLRCEKKHSFDKASQSYVHLLPVQKMKTKLPGDSREMVEARRRFLDCGYYAPFREAIEEILLGCLDGVKAPFILDAGCGEGYYTDGVHRAFSAENRNAVIAGFDISKLAVKAAAGRSREMHLAVASSFAIPVADGAVDALLSVFSPIAEEEFARVVRKGGYLLLAVASERHLFGMKKVLYDNPYENEHRETEYKGFSFVSRRAVRSTAKLCGQDEIQSLFAMTPYYWKTPADGAKRLCALDELETEIGFDLLLYRRGG